MTKKVFISQPMANKTNNEIMTERKNIIKKITDMYENVKIIDSFFETVPPDDGVDELWFLAKSLELLSTADVAFFAKGWRKYRGCRIENLCAKAYGIECIYEKRG